MNITDHGLTYLQAKIESSDSLESFRDVLRVAIEDYAQYRRTFADIEEMLKEGAIHLGLHVGDKFESLLFHCGVAVARQSADTPFAALSALVDSVIERKESPHHEQ